MFWHGDLFLDFYFEHKSQTHAHTCTHAYKHTRIHTHSCMHTRTHTNTHTHAYLHTHLNTRTWRHSHTHAQKHAHAHTHAHSFSCAMCAVCVQCVHMCMCTCISTVQLSFLAEIIPVSLFSRSYSTSASWRAFLKCCHSVTDAQILYLWYNMTYAEHHESSVVSDPILCPIIFKQQFAGLGVAVTMVIRDWAVPGTGR